MVIAIFIASCYHVFELLRNREASFGFVGKDTWAFTTHPLSPSPARVAVQMNLGVFKVDDQVLPSQRSPCLGGLA